MRHHTTSTNEFVNSNNLNLNVREHITARQTREKNNRTPLKDTYTDRNKVKCLRNDTTLGNKCQLNSIQAHSIRIEHQIPSSIFEMITSFVGLYNDFMFIQRFPQNIMSPPLTDGHVVGGETHPILIPLQA